MIDPKSIPTTAPRLGEDVYFHFEIAGSVRTRPAKIVAVHAPTATGVGPSVVNLLVFFDGSNDNRHGHERVGWETMVRMLPEGSAKPLDKTWSR